MKQRIHYIIGIIALVVFMFISVIAFYIHKETEYRLNDQFTSTELIMTKFVAHEVQMNVDRLVSELASISENPDAINMNVNYIPYFVKNNMNEVMHTDIIQSIIFVNNVGEVVYSYPIKMNRKRPETNYNYSILKKYEKTLYSGKPILSDIYDLKMSKSLRDPGATLFYPVLSFDDVYKGSIGVLIDMKKVRKEYLEPIETLRSYDISILNENGIHVDAVCKEYSGLHFYGKCGLACCTTNTTNQDVLNFIQKVLDEKEGIASYIIHDVLPSGKQITLKKSSAFSSFHVANRTFYVVLSVPYENITFLVQKNFQYILLILGITLVLILSLSYFLFEINKKRIMAEEAEQHLKAEDTLKNELTYSKEKYKKILDEALEGIAIFKGIEIIEVNSAWARMFETTIEKCIGMSIYDVVHYDSIDLVKNFFFKKGITRFEEPEHHDINITTKKGKRRIHNISLSHLSSYENTVCMISRDVTEKRLDEKSIRDAKKQLESASKDIDFYVNSIIHDMKNPLVTAQGFINILVNDYLRGGADEERDRYVEKINSNISHIFILLDSLLELSKVGRMKKYIERIDVRKEINMIKGRLSSFMEASNATLRIKNPLPVIYTDRTLLTQIFENLISNAIKFAKDDVPPVIDIDSEDMGNGIRFSVMDNGVGISERHRDLIFRVFGRVDEEAEGSGVGLNIVKKAVEELGGELTFNSKEGVGSTFYFTIPKRENFFYLKDLKTPA